MAVAQWLLEESQSLVDNIITSLDNMGPRNALQNCFTALSLLSTLSNANADLTVELPGYGSFTGTTINHTLTQKPLSTAVNAWLGIDYAIQPVGEKRFTQVDFPTPFDGVKDASTYGFSCIQDPSAITFDMDEACLSMNVFRPQNASLDQKLPILIWIHGVR